MDDPTSTEPLDVSPDLHALTGNVLAAAFEVHSELGAGLLERAYVLCLERELRRRGHHVLAEVVAPLVYKGESVRSAGYRLDLVVDHRLVIEVKSVETILPVHVAQVFTYVRLTAADAGLLINFNVPHLRDGIRRIIVRGKPRSSDPPILP